MSLVVSFRPLARVEYQDAAAHYDAQRAGLGPEFEAKVWATLAVLAEFPERYPVADGETREAPVERFPYCVYYRVRPGRVVVVAVFHQSRDPSGWRDRA